jgi:hypothetical protein
MAVNLTEATIEKSIFETSDEVKLRISSINSAALRLATMLYRLNDPIYRSVVAVDPEIMKSVSSLPLSTIATMADSGIPAFSLSIASPSVISGFGSLDPNIALRAILQDFRDVLPIKQIAPTHENSITVERTILDATILVRNSIEELNMQILQLLSLLNKYEDPVFNAMIGCTAQDVKTVSNMGAMNLKRLAMTSIPFFKIRIFDFSALTSVTEYTEQRFQYILNSLSSHS